jgi:8-oxo-dGTP pyrophosphatase MutT (NUDIX family)
LPANETRDSTEQLLIAAKKGAVRELFEETGLDLRSQLHRVNPLRLADRTNMHKNRLFFVATVQDTDFNGKIKPIDVIDADHLKVRDILDETQ